MICPKCGQEMEKGEIVCTRPTRMAWVTKNFLNEHVFVPEWRTRSAVEKDGGMMIPIRNRVLNNPTQGYCCKKCSVVLIDCNEKEGS